MAFDTTPKNPKLPPKGKSGGGTKGATPPKKLPVPTGGKHPAHPPSTGNGGGILNDLIAAAQEAAARAAAQAGATAGQQQAQQTPSGIFGTLQDLIAGGAMGATGQQILPGTDQSGMFGTLQDLIAGGAMGAALPQILPGTPTGLPKNPPKTPDALKDGGPKGGQSYLDVISGEPVFLGGEETVNVGGGGVGTDAGGGAGGGGGGGTLVEEPVGDIELPPTEPPTVQDTLQQISQLAEFAGGQIFDMPPNLSRLLAEFGNNFNHRFQAVLQAMGFIPSGSLGETGLYSSFIVPFDFDLAGTANLLGQLGETDFLVMRLLLDQLFGLDAEQTETIDDTILPPTEPPVNPPVGDPPLQPPVDPPVGDPPFTP